MVSFLRRQRLQIAALALQLGLTQQPQQWRGPGKPLRQHWDMMRLLHVLQTPGWSQEVQ